MKGNNIYFGFFVFLVLVVVCGVSFSDSSQNKTEGAKEKVAPEAYINKDQPTAIYIEGNPEPVLRIEDLPKEFPDHIQHPKGAPFPNNIFNLASLSSDGKRIAFTCGGIHEWVGVYELESKKVHVFTWLFDTHVKQILWSPNSKYFAYTYVPPRGDNIVSITGFRERTSEPYLTIRWSSIEDEHIYSGLKIPVCILIEHLEWSEDSKTISFEIHKCKIENLKLIKMEDASVDTITIDAIKKEPPKETPKKKKVKKTKYKADPQAYIKKEQPTAIYLEGNPEPVLRIEDLPKEFPDHIQHLEGAPFPDNIFNLASLSSDGKRIAFTCGYIHEWIGVYELDSKKIHVITWLFDTHIKKILWSPNSQHFAYWFGDLSGRRHVIIIGFRQETGEPYRSNRWNSVEVIDPVSGLKKLECILIEDLKWSEDSKTISFEIHKCKIENLKLIKIEDAPVDTVTIKVTKEETREDPLEVQLAEKAFWEHRLSENEQMIVDLFNTQRAAREIDTFEVNLKLSKAIKDESEKIVNLDLDTAIVEKKLFDFISLFGDKAFLVKRSSKEALLDNINLNDKLQREILHPDNIMLSLCCIEDTLRGFLYLLLYTCRFQISYGPIDVVLPLNDPDGGPISNIFEINVKTNGKYLKYNFYEGTVLPFYYKGEKMITKELETGEGGSFSIALGFSGYGTERTRLAIFVRNNTEEPYTLVDFFPVWGGIKR